MKVESKIAPSAVTVEENGDVILTENAVLIDKDGEGFYQYDEYRINVRPRAGLKESIEANLAEIAGSGRTTETVIGANRKAVALSIVFGY